MTYSKDDTDAQLSALGPLIVSAAQARGNDEPIGRTMVLALALFQVLTPSQKDAVAEVLKDWSTP